jgi:hypothetical protein
MLPGAEAHLGAAEIGQILLGCTTLEVDYGADGDRRNVSLSVSVDIRSRITVKGMPPANNYRKTSRLSPISQEFGPRSLEPVVIGLDEMGCCNH